MGLWISDRFYSLPGNIFRFNCILWLKDIQVKLRGINMLVKIWNQGMYSSTGMVFIVISFRFNIITH